MEIQVPTVKASGHLHPHHLQSLPLPCPSKGLGQARSTEDRAVLTTPGQLCLRYRLHPLASATDTPEQAMEVLCIPPGLCTGH